MRGLLSVLLMIACSAILTAGVRAEFLGGRAAPEKPVVDEPGQPPVTDTDRAQHDQDTTAEKAAVEQTMSPSATDADHVKREGEAAAARSESQAGNVATTGVSGLTDSMCLTLESAAAANGLPLEFFARVIWEESRFQPNAVGPTTRGGHRAQGIAQFMPYTAGER